jgi:hypothetical protein
MLSAASQGTSLLQSGVVAALVAAAVSLATLWATGRRATQDRQRQVFADAFEACVSYREFAYVVRRRARDTLAERSQISAQLSDVQRRLRALEARLRVEAPRVGRRYTHLVAETRRVAGDQIKKGWNEKPVPMAETGNIVGVDFSSLTPTEDSYLEAVRDHLSLLPAPLRSEVRKVWRWLRRRRRADPSVRTAT